MKAINKFGKNIGEKGAVRARKRFAVSGCVSISPFASLVGVPVVMTSSTIGLKIFAITERIKNYKSIIKQKKSDRIRLSAKTKLNSIEVFVSKA